MDLPLLPNLHMRPGGVFLPRDVDAEEIAHGAPLLPRAPVGGQSQERHVQRFGVSDHIVIVLGAPFEEGPLRHSVDLVRAKDAPVESAITRREPSRLGLVALPGELGRTQPPFASLSRRARAHCQDEFGLWVASEQAGVEHPPRIIAEATTDAIANEMVERCGASVGRAGEGRHVGEAEIVRFRLPLARVQAHKLHGAIEREIGRAHV